MSDVLISATLMNEGHVDVARKKNGKKWRVSVPPHDEAGLDEHAPEITPDDKQTILDKWATVPVPVPRPHAPPSPVVSFDDFEGKFTGQEWDDATDYVYEVDTTTGKPKRRALVQGLARAQAENRVDLSNAKTEIFLSNLVAGGVITDSRKTDILTP